MKKTIFKLLKVYPKKDTLVLSAYYPYDKSRPVDFRDKVSTYIYNQAKSIDIASSHYFPEKLKNSLEDNLSAGDSLQKGIFILAELDKKNKDMTKNYLPKGNFLIRHLAKKPKKYTTISKLPDLRQILWIEKTALDSLVVNIKRDQAEVYKLQDSQIKKLFDYKNPYAMEKEASEYQERYSTTKGQTFVHSTGDENKKRRRESENINFLNELRSKIISYARKVECVVFIFSDEFTGHIQSLAEKTAKRVQKKTILINKNLKNQHAIKNTVRKSIKRSKENETKKDYKAAKETSLLVTGLNEVTKGLRQQKVQTLFVKPRVKSPGFVAPQKLLFSYPVKGSKKVKNLFPWVLKSAAESGSEIFVLPEEKNYPPIAALYRY